MIVYIPYYNRGWHILAADTEKVIAGRRQFKRWANTERIEYCGTIYNQCFDTEEHAYAYAHFGCTNGQLNLTEVMSE